jgi:hypothetical protein
MGNEELRHHELSQVQSGTTDNLETVVKPCSDHSSICGVEDIRRSRKSQVISDCGSASAVTSGTKTLQKIGWIQTELINAVTWRL